MVKERIMTQRQQAGISDDLDYKPLSSRHQGDSRRKTGLENEDDIQGDIQDYIITLYLKDLARTPLLTFVEECELAQRIEVGRKASQSLEQLEVNDPERERLIACVEDANQARKHFVAANGLLVASIAKKNLDKGVPFLDLVQEGNIGLLTAVEKYDYRRGNRFSTYATYCIKQAVNRAILQQSLTIRVSVHMRAFIGNALDLAESLHKDIQELNASEIEQLARENNTTVASIRKAIEVVGWKMLSLDKETHTDRGKGEPFEAITEDEAATGPDPSIIKTSLKEEVAKILHNLTDSRERRVLELRFGLAGEDPKTLEQIGKVFGFTRERARQIEKEAIENLRRFAISEGLEDYLRS